MTTLSVEEFFRRYEQANEDFDVHLIAELYANTFMLGNQQGVQVIKKEDFVRVLPRRKDFMKTAGLVSSRVESLDSSALDSKYKLVKTTWTMSLNGRSSIRSSGQMGTILLITFTTPLILTIRGKRFCAPTKFCHSNPTRLSLNRQMPFHVLSLERI